ncbi:MAG: hypothetical protein EA350_04865 [Gemmatimonadales bacterium]|nr:MAG: hypothetical protein EA350_04865 [Gemmatimonadales bacterium]
MPAPALHVWPLQGIPPLPLPPREARRPWQGVGAVTGGGLVARVTVDGGLREVSREGRRGRPRALALPPVFGHGSFAGPADSGPDAFLVPGGWSRPLSEGEEEERGVVLDAFPVIVVQRLTSGASPTVLSTHLLAPEDVSAETRRRIPAALPARVLRRHARGEEEAGLDLGDAPGMGAVAAALRALDDASLADPADPGDAGGHPDPLGDAEDGSRLPAVVAGATGSGLLYLGATQLVEVALGALAGGRWQLAARIVDAVLAAEDGQASPAARLLLATRWAAWTGEVERLRPHGEALDAAARSLVPAGVVPAELALPGGAPGIDPQGTDDAAGAAGAADPDLPASFPSTSALLSDFADAVEPLGDRTWVAELRQLARLAEAARERRGAASGAEPGAASGAASGAEPGAVPAAPDVRPVRGVRLPVIGSASDPAAPETVDGPAPRPASAHLPPVRAFASPHHPSVAPRRTVHAARLVRSAVEGLCGVRPDAAWGRVTLAPDLRGLPADDDGVRHLVVRGIRVGDVRIDLACRVSRMGGTLRVSQVAGRVPVNVVFEPCLPMGAVESVRLGDESADVEIEVLEDGVRLRFQFPLDPERRVSVDGAP